MTDLVPSTSPAPNPPDHPISPPWGIVPKLVTGLVVMVLLGTFLSRFRDMIAPLILALIFAYLVNPVLTWITTRTRLPWGVAINLMYLVMFVALVTGLTAAVIGIVQQSQGLYGTVVDILQSDLPSRVQTLLTQPFKLGTYTIDLTKPVIFGPFRLDLSPTNLMPLLQQVVTAIQPAISQTGVAMGSLATVTASMFAWMLFLLVISYYLLHDLKNIIPTFKQVVPEPYAYDVQRLTGALGPIWNAFFRGQITLALVIGGLVGLVMLCLGVRYALVLGLLAAAMEFIPMIGPIVSALTGVLVALFQPGNEFGLNQLYYTGIVLLAYVVIQQIDGNVLGPRIIGGSLNLHPAVIIIGAVIGANLAGILGLILTAPTLATLRLFGGYVYRKMFDMDPWPEPPERPAPPPRAGPPRWVQVVLQGAAQLARRPGPGNSIGAPK